MPQMNPIWWLSLMLMFLTILLLTNTMIFFLKTYSPFSKIFNKKNISTNNWKW
uniref:ATP synthase F0 subunit 8 n=1 Tax=Ectopsocopsis cryptomeriae TaxID=297975 RepID=A0A8K1ZFD3_9NEOP|nr:ATP synthase F0 subunit 8 [Ectopsocopsis cryptomeriae]